MRADQAGAGVSLRYPTDMAHRCADGWFWISASRDVLEPMTDDERMEVQRVRGF